jgi:hypothetical protein
MLLLMVCMPVQALLARDAFRRSRGLRRDLSVGVVKRFAGRLGPDTVADETLLFLQKARLIPRDAEGEWWIEVLAGSGRVWRVRGELVRHWIVALSAEVPEPPPVAAVAAQWLEPVAESQEGTLLGGRRELSEAEREELRRFAGRLWRHPLPWAVGFTLWLSMPVTVLIFAGHSDSGVDWWIRFAFLAAVTLWIDLHLLRALWIARRLQQDAREGQVLIFRTHPGPAPVPSEGGLTKPDEPLEKERDLLPETVEVLPQSQWCWTEDGRPAAWRTVRP